MTVAKYLQEDTLDYLHFTVELLIRRRVRVRAQDQDAAGKEAWRLLPDSVRADVQFMRVLADDTPGPLTEDEQDDLAAAGNIARLRSALWDAMRYLQQHQRYNPK